MSAPHQEDIKLFQEMLSEFRYDFCKLVYIIFPFGEVGHELEHMRPYKWQMEEWAWLSKRLSDPVTRYEATRIIFSSGNGAAKTAWGAMTLMMLMYTQQLKARMMANTDPQMKSVVWPEMDLWFRRARFHEQFFEKFGTSIKAKNEALSETWRIDTVTWNETSPAGISGLHNKGRAIAYLFEEAPGIPAIIWQYANGAFTETETIKIFMAFGNSDDPESKFEQNMTSPLWHSRRIDTRTLEHIDKNFVTDLLMECNGNEDADEFRVRVRGMPRKTSKDSIINLENVQAAIARAKDFDKEQVGILPVVLTCDPAWRGGDSTCIAYRQGNYCCLLDNYKLDGAAGETHMLTYQKLCHYERDLKADAVLIDSGEGTAIYTLAMNAQKTSWELISFAGSANDTPESKDSEYGNIRAQMYYEFNKWLMKEGIIDSRDPEWFEVIKRQLCWTKGSRHKVTGKKLAEPKLEIKARVGQSPDIADAFILTQARQLFERLPENSPEGVDGRILIGGTPYVMPEHGSPYIDSILEADYTDLYD